MTPFTLHPRRGLRFAIALLSAAFGLGASCWANPEDRELRGYWLSADTIAVPASSVGSGEAWLFAGDIRRTLAGLDARTRLRLERAGTVADSPELLDRFPYLRSYARFKSPELAKSAGELVRNDLLFVFFGPDRRLEWRTGLQLFGVLDEIAFHDGDDLGLSFDSAGHPSFKLWAPTARSVTLHVYAGADSLRPSDSLLMTRSAPGVWQAVGDPEWRSHYYLYEVEVFVPETGRFERNFVTDPYSVSLSANSHRSFIADVNDPASKPEGWDKVVPRGRENFEDLVLYELHVRDFSQIDPSVPLPKRGQYRAFTETSSNGMRHLRRLAQAGLTHVHLLPAFDFSSVNELRENRKDPLIPENLPPDSLVPGELIRALRNVDSYNWGYDPLHFFSPEGSYASDPNGMARILEFRQMVRGLHDAGLNVVLDIVFNHTFRGGQDPRSILDRIVPGYYHRLDERGKVQESACTTCADTATEHRMMEKLMIDAVVSWARNYKVTGFRFDLMGHHTKGNLRALRSALDRLTPEKDGVNGKSIYLYGEGWTFGSLHAILPEQTATQMNGHGEGFGTFNDRLRDRLRGGNFMAETKAEQGFVTGLSYDDNGVTVGAFLPPSLPRSKESLLGYYGDTIRVGMAGNLRDFEFTDHTGRKARGSEVDYNGSPVGYTARPSEAVCYISAHDNYDLWDQIAAKAPYEKAGRLPETATLEERTRMQKLGLALVAFSQGVPFFHAGSEILRSKSGDDNSYESGDWFNRLDFSYSSNNWGVGLAPGSHDPEFWQARLRSPELKPGRAEILGTLGYFEALLKVRKSTPLLRMTSLAQVQARLHFLETEFSQTPQGLLALAIDDDLAGLPKLDPARKLLLVLVNVTLEPIRFEQPLLAGRSLRFHSEWTQNVEPRIAEAEFNLNEGAVTIPPQTVLVLEEPR